MNYNDKEKENHVKEVSINGQEKYTGNEVFSRFSRIKIYYHVLKESVAPLSNKEAKGENYLSVERKFRDAGFGNIKTEVHYDVLLGWRVKEGTVEKVTLDGSKFYSKGSSYPVDSEIVIVYHAKRKDKPK